MQYRRFKDFNTSLLGFCCMRFPTLEDGTIDEEKTFEMLDLALDNGVNYLYLLSNFKPIEIMFAKEIINGEEINIEIINNDEEKRHVLELFDNIIKN